METPSWLSEWRCLRDTPVTRVCQALHYRRKTVQFSPGRSMRSITSTSTTRRRESSFNPRSSCIAVNSDGRSDGGGRQIASLGMHGELKALLQECAQHQPHVCTRSSLDRSRLDRIEVARDPGRTADQLQIVEPVPGENQLPHAGAGRGGATARLQHQPWKRERRRRRAAHRRHVEDGVLAGVQRHGDREQSEQHDAGARAWHHHAS